MSTIFFLIGCSVLVAIVFLLAFLWAQNNGQHTDLYTPSIRILMDDADDKPHPQSLSEREGNAGDTCISDKILNSK